MSTSNASRTPPRNLAEVIAAVSVSSRLKPRDQGDVASACRSFAKMIGLPPSEIIVDPEQMRGRIANLVAPAGSSKGHLRNIKSRVTKALTLTGAANALKKSKQAQSPAWMALMSSVPDRYWKAKLTRLAGYSTMMSIAPDQVDDQVLAGFLRMMNKSMLNRPVQVHRDTCLSWNRGVLELVGWPRTMVSIPNNRNDYSRPLSEFPKSFAEDAEAFLAHLAADNIFEDSTRRPAAAITLRNRCLQIRQIASALVLSGQPIDTISSLSNLVQIDAAKRVMRFLAERLNNARSGQAHNIALVLVQLAKHWTHCSPEEVMSLQALRRKVDPGKGHMTVRNRNRLRVFEDISNVQLLVNLPFIMANRICKKSLMSYNDAVDMQSALGIAIELAVPIRAKNLASLRLDTHFKRTSQSASCTTHLIIPAGEVKNRQPLEFELPGNVVQLMDIYVRRYRAMLTEKPGGFLFPARKGGSKTPGHLGVQIQKTVRDETGLDVNLHLYRHLAAMLYLKAMPGDYETVRLLLGHKSVATTIRIYCDLKQADAVRRYDALIAGHQTAVLIP